MHHDQLGLILEIQGLFTLHKSVSMIYHINKIDKKNHIISVDAENVFNQHPFMKKNSNKLGVKRMYLNTVKTTECKPQQISYLSGKRSKLFL